MIIPSVATFPVKVANEIHPKSHLARFPCALFYRPPKFNNLPERGQRRVPASVHGPRSRRPGELPRSALIITEAQNGWSAREKAVQQTSNSLGHVLTPTSRYRRPVVSGRRLASGRYYDRSALRSGQTAPIARRARSLARIATLRPCRMDGSNGSATSGAAARGQPAQTPTRYWRFRDGYWGSISAQTRMLIKHNSESAQQVEPKSGRTRFVSFWSRNLKSKGGWGAAARTLFRRRISNSCPFLPSNPFHENGSAASTLPRLIFIRNANAHQSRTLILREIPCASFGLEATRSKIVARTVEFVDGTTVYDGKMKI